MAIQAILGSVLQGALAATPQSRIKQFQQEFQQLGQDLQSGNLAQAQSDFVTLEQNSPFLAQSVSANNPANSAANVTTASASPVAAGSNPIAQAFHQLSQDLQAGNLAGAQQDFAAIQRDFQNAPQAAGGGGGHHHHHALAVSQSSQSSSPLAQLFAQLGQSLQSGNLSSAQQAYFALQQDFQQSATSGGPSGIRNTASQIATGALNLVA
ncbi:MAG: hypothetical protein ACRD59_14045 [Candidatus Acidiferrales bacterium]